VIVVSLGMRLTNRERDLVLRGLFEVTITYADDDELREEIRRLAIMLGGDPAAMFFGAAPLRAR
jgi:hypothetical protein